MNRIKISCLTLLCCLIHTLSWSQIRALNGNALTTATIDRFLQQQMDSLKVTGLTLALINDGKIVYQQSMGLKNMYTGDKVTNQTIFECASMGKPVFAFFVMHLVEKGVLSLDTPLYKYLPNPDIAYDQRYKLITARMVLDHSSGLPNWRENDSLRILFQPGSKFGYSGEGYEYLGRVIASLTHRTIRNIDSLFLQEIADPLNLKNFRYTITPWIARNMASGHQHGMVVYESNDRTIFHPAYSLYSNATEYAKFLVAVMDGKILSRNSYQELWKVHTDLDSATKADLLPHGMTSIGLGWGIQPSPYGVNYMHGGNNWGFTGQFLINPDKRFGFVFFANTDQANELKQRITTFFTLGEPVPAK